MDWIGSEIDWIGLDWIKKIGPMSNSARAYNGGLGAELPAGSMGRVPGFREAKPFEAESL